MSNRTVKSVKYNDIGIINNNINFKNSKIFGNDFTSTTLSLDVATNKVIDMIRKGKININVPNNKTGTLDASQFNNISRSELWFYIYYLCKANTRSKIKIFNKMVDSNNRAIAKEFVEAITVSYGSIKNENLFMFINNIINNNNIKIPVLEEFSTINVIPKLSSIKIKTNSRYNKYASPKTADIVLKLQSNLKSNKYSNHYANYMKY